MRDIQLSEDEAEFAILDYSISHKEMVIRVSTPEKPRGIYFLKFEAVLYYQGPTRWIGGELRLGTAEEVDATVSRIYHPITDSACFQILSHRLLIQSFFDIITIFRVYSKYDF